ncbi:hypothetical protein EDB85DRAFT_1874457, partial [Lactarius pseudohatsudake]
VKLVHVFGGIYIWEWVSTLPFEWEVFTGQRRFRWSFIAYELCRTMALASIITLLAGFNLTHQFNCEAWFRALLVFSYLGVAFSSLLILLRGVAIWGRSLTVLIFTASVWVCNIGISIFTIMQGSVVWAPAINTCLITKTTRFRWGITVNFITDVTLLTVMFAGVLNKRNTSGLWRVLYIQGLAWILVAALSEILPAVCTLFCFRSVSLVMPGLTDIELGKYRWYVGNDYQHLLITDWNLHPFPSNRRMELGMSDDTAF